MDKLMILEKNVVGADDGSPSKQSSDLQNSCLFLSLLLLLYFSCNALNWSHIFKHDGNIISQLHFKVGLLIEFDDHTHKNIRSIIYE